MKTRTLGKNGPSLTTVGFGAWAIGGPWTFGWGPVDDAESVKAIRHGLDGGINWIDTAAVYGLGHSEEVVGKALKGRRDKVFLATKCGMIWDDQRRVTIHGSPDSIRREMENSLRRLGTDHVDLYQLHWPDPNTPAEDTWKTMADLQREGKTRYIGVCNYDVALLKRSQAIAPVQSLQPPYSMLRRDVENELLPYCLKESIGVVVYSPMQAGLLSGRFDMSKVAQDDWRRNNAFFKEPALTKNLAIVEALRPIAARYGRSVGELAIAWTLRGPAVTSAIVGARRPDQIEETSRASDLIIDPADLAAIEELLKRP